MKVVVHRKGSETFVTAGHPPMILAPFGFKSDGDSPEEFCETYSVTHNESLTLCDLTFDPVMKSALSNYAGDLRRVAPKTEPPIEDVAEASADLFEMLLK